ncbi:hypothetical protein [Pelagicoccus sp. SDUM812003]|uniref:hypothetical protein n=1 Tax=Pelagicoccus sp. SDUM812003 TaxID=3041267 RepID=UPI00280EBB8F|nr:hypothetical protein [Pelagicoccus sp. SDUM812003]MDQ8202517.1 hypothetical protein [Pelagicoccus sp. SDUM812003]
MSSTSLNPEFSKALDAKVGSARSARMAWERAAEKAVSAGLSEANALRLLALFSSPRHMEHLVQGAARAGSSPDQTLEAFFQRVDELPFSVEDWFAAFEVVLARLIRDSRSVKPEVIAGYLSCCAEFAGNNEAGQSLREIVSEMIERYGFDG